jgi:UDP-N-acetylmuramoyl-L-alanyl-D-glutamate--2,6-diaminopimelate ligase
MKDLILKLIGNQNFILLSYYKIKSVIAACIYLFPSRKIKVIGVTGTDGKTTTVNLIARMLEEAGYKVGFTSTLRYQIADEVWSNKDKMTTQSPFVVQKMLRRMVKKGCDYAILEVTSHAMVQSRVWGINFDVGVFTNISNDHIEYHGSFENYMRAKGKFIGSLFGMKRKSATPKVLIINNDDEHFEYFDQFQADLKMAYGINKGGILAQDINLKPNSTDFYFKVPNGGALMTTKLIGEFNVYNAMAAMCVGVSQGISLQTIQQAFSKIEPISGRFESVNVGQDFNVVVDYAHTPDALEKACTIFKGLTSGKLILVFGATGGGRDKLKRPVMGAIADRLADLIVLTDDDPYFEDRIGIIEQIAFGIKREEGNGLYKIVDREQAIKFALQSAKTGDTVLITGKGGEEVIVIKDQKIPYDDRIVCRKFLTEKIYSNIDAVS